VSRDLLEETQKTAWNAAAADSQKIRASKEKVTQWAETAVGPSFTVGDINMAEEAQGSQHVEESAEEDSEPEESGWPRYAFCEYLNGELAHNGGPCDCLHYPSN